MNRIVKKSLKLGIILALGFSIFGCEPRVIELNKKIIKEDYNFTDKAFPEMTSKPWFLKNKQDKDTANCKYVVDVDFENRNKMVFLNLEDLVQHEVDHDAWDIAIMRDRGAPYVVTNSGDYGSGVTFELMSDMSLTNSSSKPEDALGVRAMDINKSSFLKKSNYPRKYQKEANPIKDALKQKNEGGTLDQYYLIHAWDSNYMTSEVFAIKFEESKEVGYDYKLFVTKFSIKEVEDGVEDTHKTIKDVINKEPYEVNIDFKKFEDYGGIYIKLNHLKPGELLGEFDDEATSIIEGRPQIINMVDFHPTANFDEELEASKKPKCTNSGAHGEVGIKNFIPKKANWHLEFNRTTVYSKEMGELMRTNGLTPTSSILLNGAVNVEVASLIGWDFPEVTNVPVPETFDKSMMAIGAGYVNPIESDFEKMRKAWYFSKTMPPTFLLNQNTYVVKTPKGFAKFRPGTFYGPHGQKYFVHFRHQFIKK